MHFDNQHFPTLLSFHLRAVDFLRAILVALGKDVGVESGLSIHSFLINDGSIPDHRSYPR